jgi:wyosine [tRNA(Phe)-imidazoG37] synthetase (radical SAM superfamily)
VEAIDGTFARLAAANDIPDRITVAGNGEPTLHPDFFAWSEQLAAARLKHFGPNTKIGLLTNGLHLNKPDVINAVNQFYDEPAIKLECGTAKCFAALYQVSERGLQRTLDGLHQLDSFVVQALFIQGAAADNTSPAEITAWLEHLKTFRSAIRHVEIYTLDRPAADESDAIRVSVAHLEEIAAQVRLISLPAHVYARADDD